MTTPGGVPNLPQGALTIDNLASETQDTTTTAMKSRAASRFSSIFDTSTGLSPASDITPFGILTGLFAGFNSTVANADPADVQGPEDLPGLLLQFIEGLPVIGQFVDLLEAILGTYAGDDTVLLEVQTIFAPIRAVVDAVTAVAGGAGGIGNFFPDLLGILGNPTGLGTGSTTIPGLGSIPLFGPLFSLFGGATTSTQATNYSTNLLSFLGSPTLTGSTGSFDPTAVATNFINTVLNPTGLLTSVTAIVNAITGSTGTLTNLTSWINDLTGILGSPSGLGSGSPTPGSVTSTPLLGGLFSGGTFLTSLIPGLDTSKITSGTFPLSIVSGLLGLFGGATTSTQAGNYGTSVQSLLGNPTGMLTGSPTVPALGSIPILGPVLGLFGGATTSTQANNFFSNLLSVLSSPTGLATTAPGSFDPVAAGVSVIDSVVPAVSGSNGLFNTIFNGIFKQSDTGRGRDDVSTAVNAQTDTLIGQASDIASIRASLGAGTPDSDAFERTSSTDLGANWNITRSGSGVLATPNGHDAHDTGSGAIEYVARKTDKQASTDHQTVTNVLATAIPSFTLTLLPYGGNTDVWCRMTAFTTFATRTGLRFRINSAGGIGSTNWYIHWVSAGTETQLATGTMSAPAAGARIEFEVGVAGNMRAYQGRLNGVPVANFTDSVDRGLGTSNRFRGFGGKGNTGIGPSVGTPDLNQWTATG